MPAQRRACLPTVAAALAVLFALLAPTQLAKAQTAVPARPLALTGKPAASPLGHAKSWGYQLQGLDPTALARTPYDVLVIDYSRDGTDAAALTAAQVAALKSKPDGGKRLVLSYLSIGEAEDYRFYWRTYWGWLWGLFAPSWRSKHNAEWRGNYAVRYWEDGWQRIIVGPGNSYLDRILKAGFDGVYLDKIDSSIEAVAKSNPEARGQMIAFVARIAERGRKERKGFLVVPQNGAELLMDSGYRAVIDGLGKEDLLYGEEKSGEPNKPDSIAKQTRLLHMLTADGKPVLAVEYIDKADEIAAARKRLVELGFVPHFADRALDQMRIGDLPDPDRKRGRR
jgi:cysteinyl-tRNA synthetase